MALARQGVEIVPGLLGPAAHFKDDGATLLYPVNADLLWWLSLIHISAPTSPY